MRKTASILLFALMLATITLGISASQATGYSINSEIDTTVVQNIYESPNPTVIEYNASSSNAFEISYPSIVSFSGGHSTTMNVSLTRHKLTASAQIIIQIFDDVNGYKLYNSASGNSIDYKIDGVEPQSAVITPLTAANHSVDIELSLDPTTVEGMSFEETYRGEMYFSFTYQE